jgi:hypothetical protein
MPRTAQSLYRRPVSVGGMKRIKFHLLQQAAVKSRDAAAGKAPPNRIGAAITKFPGNAV